MKKYYPVLLSKAGELTALANLSQPVKNEIAPILQLLQESIIDDNGNYKIDTETRLRHSWSFQDNALLVDVSLLDDIPAAITEIELFIVGLLNNGVNAVPVVAPNSPTQYIQWVSQLIAQFNCNVCIRANNDSGGFLNYNAQITTLLQDLNTVESNVLLLIDLGFIDSNTYNLATTAAYGAITQIAAPVAWKEIIISAGSFLTDLGVLPSPATVTSPAIVYRLPRLEWQLWNALHQMALPRAIQYSDYGTKHPNYVPAAFEGTSSIKYTVVDDFVIYRGRKASDHARGGLQYCDSSSALIQTPDFSGQNFSWGDGEIYIRGNRNANGGNALQWVQMSQNHHITLIHSIL